MKRLTKWIFLLIGGVVGAVFAILLLRAFAARNNPPLKPWHNPLEKEARAKDLPDTATLGDYLRIEDAAFREMKEKVIPMTAPEDRTDANRYWADSRINPERFPKNWNRTFELEPEGEPKGGALLIHGLTDSPYSVKAEAEELRRLGYYALVLRMPGHGTVPGGLTKASWEDWRAAVRLGARHVRQKVGPKVPFVVAGYSNGGALSVQYGLDSSAPGSTLPKPDRILLFSPMIGVSPFAVLARVVSWIGVLHYFNQSRWTDIQPEFNPFKYNSFPAFAGQQTAVLTRRIKREVKSAADSGAIASMPPILAFVSLVDSTVETWDTVDKLFAYLPENGSELVLYDLNRAQIVRSFLKRNYDQQVSALFANAQRPYRLTLVTNAAADTERVVAKTAAPRSGDRAVEEPLGLPWPPQIFSLSHLAVPFAFDDPLFGIEPDLSVDYGIRLGRLAPRGEKGVLQVPIDQFMRINCNPFFPYQLERIRAFLAKEASR
jgi:alpha-beta hydrolase superfamily lysophospholipase